MISRNTRRRASIRKKTNEASTLQPLYPPLRQGARKRDFILENGLTVIRLHDTWDKWPDIGHPVIRVNHGTSEEPGMVTLTRYINEHVPGLTAEHIPHGSSFRLVP